VFSMPSPVTSSKSVLPENTERLPGSYLGG
jgi:hypothetical protein